MSSFRWVLGSAVITLLLAGCSILNREGPDVSCADLDNGTKNVCEDDIIASCIDGKVTYEVCDVGACSETWQTDGKFRCTQDEPVPDTNGGGGTGGSGGETPACGFVWDTETCATCVEANCCQPSEACAADESCTSCATRPGSATPCAPDMVPSYDTYKECLSSKCSASCG